jgi:hypothetical protein
MNFAFAKALLLGCLLAGVCPLLRAQTAEREKLIIFTAPDGIAVSNALLPAARSPQPGIEPDSSGEAPMSISGPDLPGIRYARPARILIQRDNTENPLDPNSSMRSPTSAEIMGVPTLEEVFGLPKPNSTNAQNQARSDGTTNDVPSYGQTPEGPAWTKILYDQDGANTYGSSQSASTNSAPSGFFSSAFGDSVFDNSHKSADSADNSAFGAPVFQPLSSESSEPSKSDSFAPPVDTSTPDDSSSFAPKASSFDAAFSTEMNSQSPFSLPKNSGFETAPQPPALPAFQSQDSSFSQPAIPSWAPKPAPWLSPVPPLGTMTPRKF